MKTSEVFSNMRYEGQAEGDRNTYHVFEDTHRNYMVVSAKSAGAYYANAVKREAVDLITRRFNGQNLTSRALVLKSRLFADPLEALNALYVTVALGRARKLSRREGKSMVFKIF